MSTRAIRLIDSTPHPLRSAALIARPCAAVSVSLSNSSRLEPVTSKRNAIEKNILLTSTDIYQEPLVTPAPEPLLLLEGDNYCISEDGTARTLYRLSDRCGPYTPISVEEVYDIQHSKKHFILRENQQELSSLVARDLNRGRVEGYVGLGREVSSLNLEEVEDGIFCGAGTGSTTWESSILMSMIFSSNPDLLFGDVIELGSGVGFGGILSVQGPYSSLSTGLKSMTMTDYSPKVLEQCKRNVTNSHPTNIPIHVEMLDWYDFLRASNGSPAVLHTNKKYDTIIACDCAYRYPDIEALTKTMVSLIRENPTSKIHIFGPESRAGLHELINQLRSQHYFELNIRPLDMHRYRIMPMGGLEKQCVPGQYVSPYASKSSSTFLHVTCSLTQSQELKQMSLTEID